MEGVVVIVTVRGEPSEAVMIEVTTIGVWLSAMLALDES
jgi:hypothetical protein